MILYTTPQQDHVPVRPAGLSNSGFLLEVLASTPDP